MGLHDITSHLLPSSSSSRRTEYDGPSVISRRKFLLRLATALHAYGSSASRTEFLIEKASHRLGVPANIAVFPSLLIISFSPVGNETSQETHMLQVEWDLDMDKLGRADELANHVGLEGPEVLIAFWRLRAIANAHPTFGRFSHAAAHAVTSASTALLFYGGTYQDALLSLPLGLLSFFFYLWSTYSSVASSCVEFMAAISVAFLTRLASLYLPAPFSSVCFFSSTLAGLTFYLPGLSLTLGVSELVAGSSSCGSARILSSLFSALQLGFGLAMGSSLVWWHPGDVQGDCSPGALPEWTNYVWFLLYVVASNVTLNARRDQWLGMSVVALVAYVVSDLTLPFGADASSVAAAFAVGVTGALYGHFTDQLPLASRTSGILVLVSGGIGVKGVTSLLQDDVVSGMGFVFGMLVVGLSITLGLLLAKIVLPESILRRARIQSVTKWSLAKILSEDGETVQETKRTQGEVRLERHPTGKEVVNHERHSRHGEDEDMAI